MGAPPIPLDRMSGAALTIDHPTRELFVGESWLIHYEASAPLPTNVGEETAIAFLTPAVATGLVIHLSIDAWADDDSLLELREAPTIVLNQGTSAIPRNRNRNSANVSGMTDRELATAARVSTFNVAEANNANLSGGTLLYRERLAIGGAAPLASMMNAQAQGERQFILIPATEYVVILTTLTANDTLHFLTLNWHEMTNQRYGH